MYLKPSFISPQKEIMDFLKYTQVWYLPLNARIVLNGLYCAELVRQLPFAKNSYVKAWMKLFCTSLVYTRHGLYMGVFHLKSDHFYDINFHEQACYFNQQTFNIRILGVSINNINQQRYLYFILGIMEHSMIDIY